MKITEEQRRSTPAPSLDLIGYRQLIERMAKNRVSQRIPNDVPEHARVLLETLFNFAKSDVRIYTGQLWDNVYGSAGLVEAARQFIDRGGRLRVLVQKPMNEHDAAEHPLLKRLGTCTRGTVEVRCATGIYATDKAKHFAVSDTTGYRFEHDHSQTKAVANFNEPSVAIELATAFDQAFLRFSLPPVFVSER